MSLENNLNQNVDSFENNESTFERVPFADKVKVYKADFATWRHNKTTNITNKFLRGCAIFFYAIAALFYGLGLDIAVWAVDFANSIKRNPSKGAGLLIASTGVFIGFLLVFHIAALYQLSGSVKIGYFCLFVLVMAGSVNIFSAMNVINKKSLGSSIMTTIVSTIVVVAGIFYIVDIIEGIGYNKDHNLTIDYNVYVAIATTILSLILTIAGTVLSFVFFDHTYERDKY